MTQGSSGTDWASAARRQQGQELRGVAGQRHVGETPDQVPQRYGGALRTILINRHRAAGVEQAAQPGNAN